VENCGFPFSRQEPPFAGFPASDILYLFVFAKVFPHNAVERFRGTSPGRGQFQVTAPRIYDMAE
jgi:hypothetical protein